MKRRCFAVLALAMALAMAVLAILPARTHAKSNAAELPVLTAKGAGRASAQNFPAAPRRDFIWALSSGDAFGFVGYDSESGKTLAYRYDLSTKSFTSVANVGTGLYEGDCFFADDKLFYLSGSRTVSVIDFVTGASTKLFEVTDTDSYFNAIGVDGQGRFYLATYDALYVYDAAGNRLASCENTDIDAFYGFDDVNGNFYYQSMYNWVYWGYDHDMVCLKAGNFDGKTLYCNDKCITIHYQNYYFTHYGCAELMAGRYLADLSTFSGNILAVLDSRKIDAANVLDTETSIDFTGGVNVTTVALPAECLAFAAVTQNCVYEDGNLDLSGVGTRCALGLENDVIGVVTDAQEVTLSRFSTGEAFARALASNPVYKIMILGDTLAMVERTGDDTYCLELVSLAQATSVTVSGPSSLKVGETADYSAITDSDLAPTFEFESSDPTVLSIDDYGRAATWKEGTVTITVRASSGASGSIQVRVSGGGIQKSLADVTSLGSGFQNNWNFNSYRTWSYAVSSYLVETASGLMAIQAGSSELHVSYLDSAGKTTSTKTISYPLPIWGGFFAGKDAYYAVYAQNNPDENDSLPVLRVVKYNTSWQVVGSCDLLGANTVHPVDAGSLRMDEADGLLYVYTCHEMYQSDDGYNHQSNLTMVVDEASMTVVDSFYDVMNLSSGYVSHSFNQFIHIVDGVVYRVDHGDAYPRGIAITMTPVGGSVENPSGYGTMVRFDGNTGANYTGASVGGFEVSDSSVIVAFNQDTELGNGIRNVKLVTYCFDDGSISVNQLTNYGSDSDVTTLTPQIVKLDARHFLVMWAERLGSSDSYTCKLALVDANGQLIGSIVEKLLALSDCQPIVLSDGSVAWFSSNGTITSLYSLNPYDLASMTDDSFGGAIHRSIAGATISQVPDQTYTGERLQPSFTVRLDGKQLTLGTDYTVYYSNNINVGTATISVIGMGSYAGTATASFKIVPASLAKASVSANDQVHTGSALEPAVTVTLGGKTLTQGTDFSVAYSNNVNMGKATITVTGIGNYTGTATGSFEIVVGDMTQAVVTAPDQSYTGSAITPELTVTLYGNALVQGKDFSVVSISDNVNVGKATVTVKGIGSYSGTASGSFNIVARSISGAQVNAADQVYTGLALQPTVAVTLAGKTLQAGTDYTVSYSDNINSGTATVYVTGKGNYGGSESGTFYINPASIEGATVAAADGFIYYDPSFKVTFNGMTLVEDVDYWIASYSFSGYGSSGSGEVTLYGVGNFAGSLTTQFTVGTPTHAPGWSQDGGAWYYYDSNGKLLKNAWHQEGSAWYYFGADGKLVVDGWFNYKGSYYCSGADGKLIVNGWASYAGKSYYMGSNGQVVTNNWVKHNGKYYYMNGSGNPVTGWNRIGGSYYYFNADGTCLVDGWAPYEGKSYYIGSDGKVVTNKWVSYGGKWYYINGSGNAVVNDWLYYGGKYYHLNANGNPDVNTWIEYNGMEYHVNGQGVVDNSRKA